MNEQLLPCPFCGKQEGTLKPLKPEGLSRVECNHCGNLAGRSEQESINQWNSRPSPWVSIETAEPPKEVPVLVIRKGIWFDVHCYSYGIPKDGVSMAEFGVTHWMPVPELPEGAL